MTGYDLKRFLMAQNNDYQRALNEIKNGRKKSHWIWYVFPQIKGLGFSFNSKYYSISSLEEAKAYIRNDVLRDRLHEITMALLDLKDNDIQMIMGDPDDQKLLSCMTLFELADPTCDLYNKVIQRFYNGERDKKTLEIINNDR